MTYCDPKIIEVNDWPDESITVEQIPASEYQITVIDGFYAEPHRVRELALQQRDWQPRREFPGLVATLKTDTSDINAAILARIGARAIAARSESSNKIAFSIVTKRSDELGPAAQVPHFDDLSDLVGLVYLNLPKQCRGGTAFYRNREYDIEAWPVDACEFLKNRGLESDVKHAPRRVFKMIYSERDDTSKKSFMTESTDFWEKIHLVKMKFNRAVFYQTSLFHSAYIRENDFGSSLAERRLTQTFFFNIEH